MPIHVPSILSAQQRGVEIGRIRLGAKVEFTNRAGEVKTRPTKLAEFRITSPNKAAVEAAAELLGGEVKPWAAPSGPQWEVYSKAAVLDVLIPPGEPIQQDMELWGKKGAAVVCLRRCTGGAGAVNRIDNRPCPCPPEDERRVAMAADGNACKPTSRLRVMLPTLPGIGVWRVESHGFYAAVELVGRHKLLADAAAQGVYVPARLRLEQRQRNGKSWGVPVLDIGVSVAQIAAGVGVGPLPAVLARAAGAAITAPQRPALPAGGGTQATPTRVIDAQPVEPAGVRAQRAADKARSADLKTLRDIGYHAKKDGLMDEFVTIVKGQPDIELGDYLAGLLEALTEAGVR